RLGRQAVVEEVKAALLEQCEQLHRLLQELFSESPSLSALLA
ncbi:hypothetical protein VT98_11881, partial [Candidatus Electrothrix communis]